MPANTEPIFPVAPNIGIVQAVTNTNRDGSGSLATAFTAGSNGSRIERAYIHATGNTTAGMIRIFLHFGSTASLLDEIPVSAITPSGTVAAFSALIQILEGLVLPSGYTVKVSTNNGETFNIIVIGGDY